jgi:hypothetical protein
MHKRPQLNSMQCKRTRRELGRNIQATVGLINDDGKEYASTINTREPVTCAYDFELWGVLTAYFSRSVGTYAYV